MKRLLLCFLCAFAFVTAHAQSGTIKTFSGHKGFVYSVCFSPDGKQALSGSHDKTMKLWDIATGREIRTFSGHTDKVDSISFSPDGKQALSSTGNIDDGTMRLWDIATGQEIGTFRDEWAFHAMCISPDGNFALSSDGNYKIKLWDLSARPRQQYQLGPSVTNPTVNPPPPVNTWDTPKPAQTQTRCSTCNGSGNCKYCRNGNCNTCNGTGKISHREAGRYTGENILTVTNCTTCYGSGKCQICRGSGKCTACNGKGYF